MKMIKSATSTTKNSRTFYFYLVEDLKMNSDTTKFIWFNGKMVPWADAKVHVTAHALHYGSAVFEGIRAYSTKNGPQIFRLKDHIDRLFNSAKIYRGKFLLN